MCFREKENCDKNNERGLTKQKYQLQSFPFFTFYLQLPPCEVSVESVSVFFAQYVIPDSGISHDIGPVVPS